MAIEFTHHPENNILLIKISGVLEMEQLKLAAEKLLTSDTYPKDINTIYDLQDMDFSNITREFEDKVITFRKQLNRGNAKIACVTPSDVGFGMGRMYQILSEDLPQQVGIFRTIEEALDWLK